MPNKVEFTREAIKEYLDNAIRSWRKRVEEDYGRNPDEAIARCYVDAYQSVRVSLFGELLSKDKGE